MHSHQDGQIPDANFSHLRDAHEESLHITMPPSSYCLPEEILTYQPKENEIFRIFFQGTSKEVRIRQIFCHTPLTETEQQWIQEFRHFCYLKHFFLDPSLNSYLLRLCYFCIRKYGKKDYLKETLELLRNVIHWRTLHLPLSDTEPDILQNLSKGIAYWVARDTSLRPLLVLRLKRLEHNVNPQQFKRLIIFCFEWAIRYLMVPGIVETCLVVVDTRGVALHRYPVSVLIEITDMLTCQYPFRLHCMFVISQSFFVQILWNAVKPFLTELQQEKIKFIRTCHEILLNISPLHLEKCYDGVREELTHFYPFPLLPGPFHLHTKALNYQSKKDCYKLTSRKTCKGVVWENDITTPVQWVTPIQRVMSEEEEEEQQLENIFPFFNIKQESKIQQKLSKSVLKETQFKSQEGNTLNDEKLCKTKSTLSFEENTTHFTENTSKALQCYPIQTFQEPSIHVIQPCKPNLQTSSSLNFQHSESVSFKKTKESSSDNYFKIIQHIKTILFPFRFNCYSKDQTRLS